MKMLKTAFISLACIVFLMVVAIQIKNVEARPLQEEVSSIFSDLASSAQQVTVHIESKINGMRIKRGGAWNGAGVIISKNGYIITNSHVIGESKEIKITTFSNNDYQAKIIGRDPKTDIALLKIEPSERLSVAKIGDSDKIEIGQLAMAVGSPFGFTNSVTVGVISGKGRLLGAGPFDDFIQTDAAINPGNSGGPLFNINGEVIGINTAIVTKGETGIGIGFAIPINMAMAIVDQLKKNGKIIRGRLGVIIRSITSELKKEHNLLSKKGAYIQDIAKDGPASKSDLKKGDVIIRFNGKEIRSAQRLPFIISMSPLGKEIEIVVLREGKEKTIKAILEERDPNKSFSLRELHSKYGFSVGELDSELAEELSKKNNRVIEKGVIISDVERESPAHTKLMKDDLIISINNEKVGTIEDYATIMLQIDTQKQFLITVLREGVERYMILKLD